MESSGCSPPRMPLALLAAACLVLAAGLEPVDCTLGSMLQSQVISAPRTGLMQPTLDSRGPSAFLSKPSSIGFQTGKSTGGLRPTLQASLQTVAAAGGAEQLSANSLISDISSHSIPGKDILKEVQGFMGRFIAPAKNYANLINRYHKWFTGYESVRKAINHPILEPCDVFKLEYAQVEKELIEDELKKVKMSSVVDAKVEELENMDFVFRVLKKIIVNLEADLKLLEENEHIVPEVNVHPEAAIENEEAIKEAMARVERSLANQAKSIIKEETGAMIKRAAYTGLAVFMEAKPNTGDFLDHLRPIISILACASTPVAVGYLQDVQFRASLAIVTHGLEAIMPLSKISEKLEDTAKRARASMSGKKQ